MSLIGTKQTSKHVRSDVRVRGQSGHQMLEVSFSAYDPKRTSPMLFGEYSLHEPRRGRDDIEAFMTDFRKAAPDSNFWAPRT